jgi:hypothetical protein
MIEIKELKVETNGTVFLGREAPFILDTEFGESIVFHLNQKVKTVWLDKAQDDDPGEFTGGDRLYIPEKVLDYLEVKGNQDLLFLKLNLELEIVYLEKIPYTRSC